MSKRGEETQAEVLAILRRHPRPLSAYDVLREMLPTTPKISPPTVYRALAALTERGQVHRLESLNAFIACRREGRHQASIISICDDCGTVEECAAPDVLRELSNIAGRSGFAPTRHVVEVHGICVSCGARQATA